VNEIGSFFPETIGTVGAMALALFAVYSALRKDNAKRFDRYTDRLEKRVSSLEERLTVEQHRRFLLEALLRANGLEIPPWAEDPETVSALEYVNLAKSASPR
jgi:lipoate-protein ligase A